MHTQFFLVCAGVLLIAYLVGLTIINVVDTRLNQLQINLPEVPVHENFANQLNEALVKLKASPPPTSPQDNPEGDIENRVRGYTPTPYTELDRQMIAKDLWNAGRSVACFQNHAHIQNSKNCTMGPCNHVDPRKMSPVDREFFKRTYLPTNMTLQDYVNWLWLYAGGDESRLPYEHLKNLEKLKRGEKLRYEVGVLPPPQDCMPSVNSEDHYNCFFGDFETRGPMADCKAIVGYNVDSY